MPLYEYECKSCDKIFEVIQKFSDAPLARCESCGAEVNRLISRSSFQLKGSGWYATDYKKSSAVPEAPKPEAPKGGCGAGTCGHSHGGAKAGKGP